MTNNAPLPRTEFEQGLASCPVMAVLRGLAPVETVRLAELAWSIGITQVEIPIESADAVPSLAAAVAAGRERGRTVGAGTIVTREQLAAALEHGAAYGVSPGLDPELVGHAAEASLPFLPGVATPSEILLAQRLGFTWIKAFPATVLGCGWFSAMRGPFPHVNFVATGGVNGHNAAEILAAGASVVGVGSPIGDPEQRQALAELIANSQQPAGSV
ncbi:MAG: bifunctional 4-hydroxy-2-oxoglutarate aldolase/2-dehydro-3-deoxy-phosphogluconate aldolase [Leucobacter sp.]